MSPISAFIARRPWLHFLLYFVLCSWFVHSGGPFDNGHDPQTPLGACLLQGFLIAIAAYAFFWFVNGTTWSTLQFHIGRSALARRTGKWFENPKRSRRMDRLALWATGFTLVFGSMILFVIVAGLVSLLHRS